MRKQMTVREAVAGPMAAVFLLAGCQAGTDAAPVRDVASKETAEGVASEEAAEAAETDTFTYRLYTHCGIRWAKFSGKLWVTPFLGNARTKSAPEGWGDPVQQGRVRLLSKDRAIFTSEGHDPLVFRATDKRPEGGCA